MATDGPVGLTLRGLGAASLLSVGAVHLQQYDKLYSEIPTIGTLFLLSFVGAAVVSVLLVAPVGRLPGRWGDLAPAALAAMGIGQAVLQFVFLAISEQRPLFGFQEPGYDPTAILAARAAEVATVVFLAGYLVARLARLRTRTSTRQAGREPASAARG